MNTNPKTSAGQVQPDVSFVMPCYNEEESIGYTIPKFVSAFEKAGHRLELIAVDNGSTDRTGEIIKELAASFSSVRYHRVEKNEGYGHGILSGFELCSASWIGIILADGQVDAEDVVNLYESVAATNGKVIGKVRRRFRLDGLVRKVVSVTYNVFVRILWPRLETIDINGNPKIFRREVLLEMDLQSKGWFLDPEIMIKGHYMGLRVLEFNVFGRMRGNGLSHVRPAACWEFFYNLLGFRFSRQLSLWKQDHKRIPLEADRSKVNA
jgi:glycosyltransferase involved in cell wall biosynthesis